MATFTFAAARSPAVAQVTGEQVQPPRPEHEIKRLWRDIDQRKFEVEQIYIYTRYCKPPDGPNIADTQWEIDFAAHLLKFLQLDFDRLESSFTKAGNSPIGNSYRASFPPLDGVPSDHRDYWPRAKAMLSDVAGRIKAKQDTLNTRKEENCGARSGQPAGQPPPPPPVDWLKALKRPVPVEVRFAKLEPEFCSQTDKHEWIKANIVPPRQAANDNARAAADYRVDVGRRMRELEAKDIAGTMTESERAGWRKLIDEYQWASDNLAEQDHLVRQMDQHYSAALAIPLIDCSTNPPRTRIKADPVTQPVYEMFGFLQVPARFCSQAEKDAAVSQLTAARDAARRNADLAAAKVIELGDRIAAGDQSTELSVGSSRVDLQACKLEYSIVSPK